MIIVAIVLRLFKMAPKNLMIYMEVNSAIGSRFVIVIMIILKQMRWRETGER